MISSSFSLSGPPPTEQQRTSLIRQESNRLSRQINQAGGGLFSDEQMRRAALNLLEDAEASRLAEQEESHKREITTQALHDSENRLQLALDAAAMAAWDFDVQRNSVIWNDQHYHLLGLTPDRKPKGVAEFMQYVHPEDHANVSEAMRHAVEESGLYKAEFRIVRTNGAVRWMSGFGKVMERHEGRATRMTGVMFDVTERHEAEEKLAEALRQTEIARAEAEAAGRAKDEFLAVLSHELRTPLTPLLLVSDMLLHEPGLPDHVLDCIKMMQRNVRLEARLVDDLLDVTRIARGCLNLQFADMDMHESIQHAVAICRPDIDEKVQRLEIALNATRHHVHGDCARIQQVVWNLLRNACKFTPSKGTLRLETHDVDDGILIHISDTGIGMDEEELARIFCSFVQANKGITRKFGGLGLGLAISKAIVESHGGRIWAESAGREHGTSFHVVLPLKQPA